MKLRSGKIISVVPSCRHKCQNYSQLCCCCSDKRPYKSVYIAFDKPSIFEFSCVPRYHRYCPTCKSREAVKHPFTPPPIPGTLNQLSAFLDNSYF